MEFRPIRVLSLETARGSAFFVSTPRKERVRMVKATTNDEFFTTAEVAQKLKMSDRSIRDAIAAGEIRAVRLRKRVLRVSKVELERLATGQVA